MFTLPLQKHADNAKQKTKVRKNNKRKIIKTD